MKLLPIRESFRLVKKRNIVVFQNSLSAQEKKDIKNKANEREKQYKNNIVNDRRKRLFLKALGAVGLGVFGATLFPKKAQALVMGGTPSTSIVGLKDENNLRINPATEETLQDVVTGNAILKKTIPLTDSGTVHTPGSGKKIRLYNTKFSLTADMTSVSFRFTSGGSDFEKYLAPKTGGLYGIKNHPNYVEGAVDQILYCAISGTGTVQINIDYLEI